MEGVFTEQNRERAKKTSLRAVVSDRDPNRRSPCYEARISTAISWFSVHLITIL